MSPQPDQPSLKPQLSHYDPNLDHMPSEPLSRLGPYAIAIAMTVPTQSATINQTCHLLKKKKKNPRATHHILYFESILYITCKHKENVVYLYIHLLHISLIHTFFSVFLTSNQKQPLSCTKNETLSKDFMHTKSPKASNPLCSIFVTWALEKKKKNTIYTLLYDIMHLI